MIIITYQRSLMALCMGVIGAQTTKRWLKDLVGHLVLIRVVIRPIVISSELIQDSNTYSDMRPVARDTPGTPLLDRLGSGRLGSSRLGGQVYAPSSLGIECQAAVQKRFRDHRSSP
jgi:hypothetical protein